MKIVLALTGETPLEAAIFWMECFVSSGTTLPLTVLSARGAPNLESAFASSSADAQIRFKRAEYDPEDAPKGPHPVSLREYVMMQAHRTVGDCFVLRPDAFPIANLDHIADVHGSFLLASDPGNRQHPLFGQEMAAGAMLQRYDVWEKFSEWWTTTISRVGSPREGLHPENYGQVLASTIYHELNKSARAEGLPAGSRPAPVEENNPFESISEIRSSNAGHTLPRMHIEIGEKPELDTRWCYSHQQPIMPVNVLWLHGKHGLAVRPGVKFKPGYYPEATHQAPETRPSPQGSEGEGQPVAS